MNVILRIMWVHQHHVWPTLILLPLHHYPPATNHYCVLEECCWFTERIVIRLIIRSAISCHQVHAAQLSQQSKAESAYIVIIKICQQIISKTVRINDW